MPTFHPPGGHYEHCGVQPIDYIAASFLESEYRGYLRGNIIKYLARYQYKGTPIADLEKAQTYLTWLIEFEGDRPADETQEKGA